MKFLAFVDLHDDKRFLQELAKRAKEPDIDFVLCAGDLSQFGRGLTAVLDKFKDSGKKLYLIPGNHETDEMFSKVDNNYPNLINFNRQAVRIGNYVFLGYGEGGFAQEDPEFRKLARDWYGKYKNEKLVLVTHGPPYGTKQDWLENRHVGNKDFRQFIERIKPLLVVCGHVHETAQAIDEISGVKIVNPGWEGMVIELP